MNKIHQERGAIRLLTASNKALFENDTTQALICLYASCYYFLHTAKDLKKHHLNFDAFPVELFFVPQTPCIQFDFFK